VERADSTIGFVRKLIVVWIAAGAAVFLVWLWFVVSTLQRQARESVLQKVTVDQFDAMRPTLGYFEVSGGRLAYERVLGDEVKDEEGQWSFRSYIPYTTMGDNKRVVLLQEWMGSDADPKVVFPMGYKNLGPNKFLGTIKTGAVEPSVYKRFADEKFPIDPTTPVLVAFGSPTTGDVNKKIVIVSVLALLLIAAPAIPMFWPKQKPRRRKSTPTWR
jgi:hypothetical protein